MRVGGWFFEIDRGEDGERFTLDKTLGAEALLLGRRSYEFFAATWPSRAGELPDKMNSLPKYVVSSTLEDPDWNNSTLVKGDVVDEVSKLKQELNGEIVVLGSPQLARTLIEHDLVDELRLMIHPVVLGAAARLFGGTSDKKRMRLVDTRTVGDGIAILTYEPSKTPNSNRTARAFRTSAPPLSTKRASGRTPSDGLLPLYRERIAVGVLEPRDLPAAGPR